MMSLFTLVFIAVTFLFALAASWALVVPFFSSEGVDSIFSEEDSISTELVERKERIMEALEDLEQDIAGGKISELDYERNKAELTAEAAKCLAEIDKATQDES